MGLCLIHFLHHVSARSIIEQIRKETGCGRSVACSCQTRCLESVLNLELLAEKERGWKELGSIDEARYIYMYKKWLRAFEYKRLSIDKVSSKCPEKGKRKTRPKTFGVAEGNGSLNRWEKFGRRMPVSFRPPYVNPPPIFRWICIQSSGAIRIKPLIPTRAALLSGLLSHRFSLTLGHAEEGEGARQTKWKTMGWPSRRYLWRPANMFVA